MKITNNIVEKHGLKQDEYSKIKILLSISQMYMFLPSSPSPPKANIFIVLIHVPPFFVT